MEYDSGWVGAGETDDLDRALLAEADNEPFDLTAPHVMTALGPVDPPALGITLGSSSWIGADEPLGTLVDGPSLAAAELELFHAAGGRAVLVAAIAGDEISMDRAREVATRSPCHLVLTANVDELGARVTVQLVETLAALVTPGRGPHRVRAGLLGIDCGDGRDGIATIDVADAVAETHHLTGVPVLLRGRAAAVDDWFDRLTGAGVRPDRVVIALLHEEDGEADRPFLDGGATLLIEREAGSGVTDGSLATAISRRVADGFGSQLLLGDRSGHGWNDLLERLPLTLMETGMDARQVRQLLVENPARALSIVKDER